MGQFNTHQSARPAHRGPEPSSLACLLTCAQTRVNHTHLTRVRISAAVQSSLRPVNPLLAIRLTLRRFNKSTRSRPKNLRRGAGAAPGSKVKEEGSAISSCSISILARAAVAKASVGRTGVKMGVDATRGTRTNPKSTAYHPWEKALDRAAPVGYHQICITETATCIDRRRWTARMSEIPWASESR